MVLEWAKFVLFTPETKLRLVPSGHYVRSTLWANICISYLIQSFRLVTTMGSLLWLEWSSSSSAATSCLVLYHVSALNGLHPNKFLCDCSWVRLPVHIDPMAAELALAKYPFSREKKSFLLQLWSSCSLSLSFSVPLFNRKIAKQPQRTTRFEAESSTILSDIYIRYIHASSERTSTHTERIQCFSQ